MLRVAWCHGHNFFTPANCEWPPLIRNMKLKHTNDVFSVKKLAGRLRKIHTASNVLCWRRGNKVLGLEQRKMVQRCLQPIILHGSLFFFFYVRACKNTCKANQPPRTDALPGLHTQQLQTRISSLLLNNGYPLYSVY